MNRLSEICLAFSIATSFLTALILGMVLKNVMDGQERIAKATAEAIIASGHKTEDATRKSLAKRALEGE